MEFNRRKFILTSALGIGGLAITTSAFGQLSIIPNISSSSNLTIMQLLRSAALKRKDKLYFEATEIYNSIILIDSNEIRAYDGIRKILLADKFREMEVLNLYLDGYNLNPTNPFFKQRTAKEYMRLALGNKKFKDQLNYPEDLLEKAKTLLEQAKIEVPNDEQMQKLFEKADFKVISEANVIDARLNGELKQYKKENHTNYKQRFETLSSTEIKIKLDGLLVKTSDAYRDVHIRELYRTYIKKLRQENNLDLATQISKDLYLFDKKDVHSLKIVRNVCKKDEKYDVLEVIERKNDAIKKSFWSKIALFDVIYKRYEKSGIGSTTELKSILNAANNKKFTFYHQFEYNIRQVKLAMVRNKLVEAKTLLDGFADNLVGTSSAHFINKFNVLCVDYFFKINDKNKALQVFQIALKQNEATIEDEFLTKLILVNREKDLKKEIHNQRLIAYREKMINSY